MSSGGAGLGRKPLSTKKLMRYFLTSSNDTDFITLEELDPVFGTRVESLGTFSQHLLLVLDVGEHF
jgi:hypothetical protein